MIFFFFSFFLINYFQQVVNFGGLILQNRSHFFCFGEGNMYSLGIWRYCKISLLKVEGTLPIDGRIIIYHYLPSFCEVFSVLITTPEEICRKKSVMEEAFQFVRSMNHDFYVHFERSFLHVSSWKTRTGLESGYQRRKNRPKKHTYIFLSFFL